MIACYLYSKVQGLFRARSIL
uniref:Uncharacterized protein n=1 Tax=Arundo donax TaxID=35708 RepID=A0A0A9AI87_ARUDO